MSIVQFLSVKNYKTLYCLVFLVFPFISYSQKIESREIESDTAFQISEDPNALLIETVAQLIPGKALDLGMGFGRNSIYLAMNGWDVTGINMVDDDLPFGFAEASKN